MVFAEFYTLTPRRDALVPRNTLRLNGSASSHAETAKQYGRRNGFLAFRLTKGPSLFDAKPITHPQRLAPSRLPILGP